MVRGQGLGNAEFLCNPGNRFFPLGNTHNNSQPIFVRQRLSHESAIATPNIRRIFNADIFFQLLTSSNRTQIYFPTVEGKVYKQSNI
jgi:hypothetical protein